MSQQLYLADMDHLNIHATLIAQDAAEALSALGWPVTRRRRTWTVGRF